MRDDCLLCSEDQPFDTGMPLLCIRQEKSHFILHQQGLNNGEQMWLAIKYLDKKRRGHKLAEGDVLRLGRVKVRVKHIHKEGENPIIMDSEKKMEEPETIEPCRICLCDTQTPENPLISPCKCSGSMQYVHVSCLKEWLSSKVTSRRSVRATSYFWRDLSCELCKENLPSSIEVRGQTIELVHVTYPDKPYVILEDYRPDRSESNGIHIITLENNSSLLIGRAHDCEVKLSDISVSRSHAIISNIDNKFYISDADSKFGTLLLLKAPIALNTGNKISVQVSRTLLQFNVRQPWNWKSCVCCKKNSVRPEYSMLTFVEAVEGQDDEEEQNQSLRDYSVASSIEMVAN